MEYLERLESAPDIDYLKKKNFIIRNDGATISMDHKREG